MTIERTENQQRAISEWYGTESGAALKKAQREGFLDLWLDGQRVLERAFLEGLRIGMRESTKTIEGVK